MQAIANLFGRTSAAKFAEAAERVLRDFSVPAFVLNAEGRVIVWNMACEVLTGVAASSVLGTKNHWRGFYPIERPCLADLLIEARTGDVEKLYERTDGVESGTKSRSTENWCQIPNGRRLYLAIDACKIYDDAGKIVAVVETVRDLTEQQETKNLGSVSV